MDPPSETVTFLFTDIEGSTRRWESAPDAMRVALARHDEILRGAIVSHRGEIFSTGGDGFAAAFPTARDALAAALAAQRALHSEAWEPGVDLRVRMGMHAGEAEHRDGDYFGPTLNRAARLMSAAHGGQVVVSLVAERLLADELPEGVTLVDLGEHRLRDLSRAERVFQVAARGIPSTFETLRSLETYRTNLPLQVTSFVGREHASAELSILLTAGKMVTVTGVGGVGKTRLALNVAADLLPEYADGAWLVELATAADRDDLWQIVASALEVSTRPGLSLAASVLETLRSKELLLVVDNCEHLLEPAAELAEQILQTCPDVRVLATSREGLGVAGEQVWPLRSLPVPDPSAPVDELVAAASVALFVERARAASPMFIADEDSARSVAEICRRLDGIPLAIELAAARVAGMTPQEISSHLDERFRLLTGGRRSATERHQTLQATVSWSYSLLSPLEQRVFDSIAVLAGSFDVSAATAVVAGDGIEAWDVIEALTSLLAKSMLSIEGSGTTTRYRQLETLRQYAYEQLREAGLVDRHRRQHAEHFASFAEDAAVSLMGPDELNWAARLTDELDNLRAALTWALDSLKSHDHQFALRIVAACATEANSGRTSGVGEWAERVLPLANESHVIQRAAIHSAAAWHALHRGDIDRARSLAIEATDSAVPGDSPIVPLAYMVLGIAALVAGDMRQAVEIARVGRARITVDNAWGTIVLTTAVASFALLAGDLDTGTAEAAVAERLANQLGNPTLMVSSKFVAVIPSWRQNAAAAARALDECIALTRAGAAGVVFGHTLAIRSILLALEGDAPAALARLREALRYSHDKGDLPMLSVVFDYGLQTLEVLRADEPATFFAGCATSDLMSLVSNLPPQERPHRAYAMNALRDRLGADTYDAEVLHAAALPIDDAVADGLAQLDQLMETATQLRW